MKTRRSSGILLPISSLPAPYGIGTLGKCAYEFVDFLTAANQSWWQILPVGPTGYGDSPYQSFSSYAGNPYFIDWDMLVEEGLLRQEEIVSLTGEVHDGEAPEEEGRDGACAHADASRVDYGKLYRDSLRVLERAYQRHLERGGEEEKARILDFFQRNKDWLDSYSLYMAVKKHFNMASWQDWEDEDIRLRKQEALDRYRALLKRDIDFYIFVQYLFFSQWDRLKSYAQEKGIGIIGDIPIYVSMDSADVWAHPEIFLLDEGRRPLKVAGVPPDYFNENGQLWGNPLYNWTALKESGYQWWLQRIFGAARLYDSIRIDHFRGLESYWAVPFGAETAKNGEWVEGPGMDFVGVLKTSFPHMEIIAEDLGYLTPQVRALLAASGFPGMKVLEFAFNPHEPSDYLPHNHVADCVCYGGTHDNAPLMEWYEQGNPEEIAFARAYFGLESDRDFHWSMIRGAMASVAKLLVIQMQDYLGLGASSRMNTPGNPSGNWQWRLLPGQADEGLAKRISAMTEMFERGRGRSEKP